MRPRIAVFVVLTFAAAAYGQVKTKVYAQPEGCARTYQLTAGQVLTSRGLIEDPTVNATMKDAVAVQMKGLWIAEADQNADLQIHFMGGTGAGLQVDDLAVGDVAMWNIGASGAVSGRTYKKSSLVIAVVDTKSNRTLWAARCSDKFGDPERIRERIEKAVAKAFSKFPKKFACSPEN